MKQTTFLVFVLLNTITFLRGSNTMDSTQLVRSILTEKAIISIDFSPDGKFIISGGANRMINIWEFETGKLVKSLEGHEDDILSVACSSNNRFIASAGVDKKIMIWDMITGDRIHTLTGHNDYIRDLVFSPDGKLLASASWDRTAIIWNVATGTRVQTLSGHRDNVTAIDWNTKGDQVITGCGDHDLRIWAIKDGKLIRTFEGHTDEVWDVTWQKNYVASGAWDNHARIWNANSAEQIRAFPGHVTDVWSTDFDNDVLVLATSGGDRKVKLWDVASGQLIIDLSGDIHKSDVEEVKFSPDGRYLASASRDGSIRIWNVPSLEERIVFMTNLKMEDWREKNKFETSSDYRKRIKNQDNYFEVFKGEIVESIKEHYLANLAWAEGIELGEYNADDEYFVLKTPALGELHLEVPLKQAEILYENYERVEYKNLKLNYQGGKFIVDSMTAFLKGLNRRYEASLPE